MALKTILNRPNSIVNDAWLGLGDLNGVEIENPLLNRDIEYIENPGLLEIKLMRDPNYLSFAAKVLLDIDLLPVQSMIMEELWWRPFPMYIASRGAGKAQRTSELILTPNGWIKNGDLKIGDEVYDRYGNIVKVIGIFPQGKKRVCRLTLLDGRSIDCCEDHMWTVFNQGKEKVVSTKKIIESGIKYPNSVYKYKIPNCEPIPYSKKDLPLDPYILGCLLGDGCLTTLTPKIASDDEFIIEQFRNILDGFELKKDTTNNNYTIVDRNKPFTERISKSGKKYYSRHQNRLTLIIRELGLNVGCKDKFIPEIYKYSSIEDRMELIRGLFDTDGSISKDGAIEFTNTCEQLIDDVLEVLRSLGITCKKAINDRSDQLMTLPQGTVTNRRPYFRIFVNTSKPVFKLPRKLSRIKKKATNAEKYVSIVDAKYTDEYDDMQCIAVDSPDHTYITKDYIVTHNSFLLAVYCTLKCALIPNSKIVTVGAAFRQSKVIFEYMDTIWSNAPVLRSVCNNTSGPRTGIDRCIMRINDSKAIFIPLGDGCAVGDTLITYDDGFGRIDKDGNVSYVRDRYLWDGSKFNYSDEYYYNGVRPIKRITTRCGYTFAGTHNHKLKVLRNNEVQFVQLDQMQIGDHILIDRSERWHNGQTNITPDEARHFAQITQDEVPMPILSAPQNIMTLYLKELCSLQDGRIIFESIHQTLIRQLQFILLHYGITSTVAEEKLIVLDEISFKHKILGEEHSLTSQDNIFYDQITKIVDEEPQPTYDLHVPQDHTYIANGFISHNSKIRGLRAHSIIADEFSCVGWDTLIETDSGLKRIKDCFDEDNIQVLNRYGNYEKPNKYIRTPKTDVYKITTQFGFSFRCSDIHKVLTKEGWKVAKDLTNDDYLVINNKYKFPERAIISIESAIELGKDGKFDRVPNCVLESNRDVVVAFLGGLFKTYGIVEHGSFIYYLPSEDLASEVHVLLWKAGYLSSLAGKVITVHFGDEYRFFTEILRRRQIHGVHNRELIVRVSSVEKLDAQEHLYDFFLPHTNSFYGNGFVQHNSIPPDIYETVVRGFAAVSAKPVDNVKEYARRQAMINMGTWSDRAEKNFTNRVGNQCIISGTADYDFMHYADYWKRYIVSIRSGGDPDKPVKLPSGETKTLREYYPDGIPDSFSSNDYSVIRIPYELVPKGFMDDKVVSAAKSSSHRAIYLKEYAACAKPDTLIITDTGCKPIQDIRVGDMVFTHKGRFRPVTKCTYRRIKEEMPHIRCRGYNKYIAMTKNHPWFDGEKFVECDAADKAVFPNLSELSNETFDEEYGKIDFNLGAELARNRVVFPAKLLCSNEGFLNSVLDEYFNDSDTFTHTNLDLCVQLKLCLSYFGMPSSIEEHDGKYTISLIRGIRSIPLKSSNDYVVQDKYYEYYDGFVYNLEVEEDNSYCTLAGAVHNCFPSDSDGFFKRSMIQACVTSDTNPIELPSGPVWFDAMISGNPGYKYVYGVDPAAERDNFSIVILELHDDHTRIVYCWSTNIHDFEKRKKAGIAEEYDYYGFCARKIRNLMKVFPTEDIAIDAQGGGRAILEAFHDPDKLQPGELFLWPTNRILDPDKELPTDDEPGLHICHMCQFANFNFLSEANHGTRKDFAGRVLLFPRFDPVTLELAAHADAQLSKKLGVKQLYDTLEDCVMEIEELKDELCTIIMTRTGTGVNSRDRWDTPETVTVDGKKTRMRKDRYSALIMANYIARSIQRAPAPVEYNVIGGFAHQMAARENNQKLQHQGYQGPEWFTKAAESFTTVNKIVHKRE